MTEKPQQQWCQYFNANDELPDDPGFISIRVGYCQWVVLCDSDSQPIPYYSLPYAEGE